MTDVNECSHDDPAPCGEEEYCVNTEGSFSCKGVEKLDNLTVHPNILYS